MGRPTKYNPEFNEMVEKFCKLGATNEELADFLGVSYATLKHWKDKNPEFKQAVMKGKAVADAKVAEALYQRAIGYSHNEDKIFQHEGSPIIVPTKKHYPPDTAAAFIWLRNRRPKDWRQQPEVIQHEHTVKELKVVKASEYLMEVSKKVS